MTGMTLRLLFAVLPAFAGTHSANSQDALPDGDGRDIVEYVCSQCHDLMRVTDARKTPDQWRYLVTMMMNQGAPIEEYEVDTVVRYLSEHFGQ